ncbi:MAG TPA: hypothetical protein VF092_02830 [Longimicrobium sp.]
MNFKEASKWLLGSAGLTGILLTLGFVLRKSSEDFLGYRLGGSEGAQNLVGLAGEFLYAILSVTLQWIGAATWHGVATLAIVAAVILLSWKFPQRLRRPRTLLVALASITLLQFFLLDVPTFFVSDMLVNLGANSVLAAGMPIQRIAEDNRTSNLCSRMSGLPAPPEIADRIEEDMQVRCTKRSARYADRLRALFVLNSVFTVAGVVAALGIMLWLNAQNSSLTGVWRGIAIGTVVLLAVDFATGPYQYAKTARSIRVQRVRVEIARGDSAEWVSGLLLGEGAQLSMYVQKDHRIWVIPDDRVRMIQINGSGDVLEDLLSYRLDEIRRGVGQAVP